MRRYALYREPILVLRCIRNISTCIIYFLPLFYAVLHRRQHGDSVLPLGPRRQREPGGQRGMDVSARRRLLRLQRHRRVSRVRLHGGGAAV